MSAQVLKSCNCCLTHKASVRLMGTRARIAWCRSCKARTVWQELDAEALAAWDAKRARTEATIAWLTAEMDADDQAT